MSGSQSNKEQILKNLSPPKEIPFSEEEYRDRLISLKDEMRKSGIDILFLSSPESLYYISGYKAEWYMAHSPDVFLPAGCIAVHADRDDFILFDDEEEEIICRFTTIAKDIRICTDTADTSGMLPWIVSELKKDGWLPGRVALEMKSYRPYRIMSENFQREFEREGCSVIDGTYIVRKLRSVKSSKELEYIERAGEIAELALRTAIEYIRPGVTELDVYGELVNAMAKAGGENPAIPVLVASGKKIAALHALSSRKKIEKGELVNIDICGVYNRYHANMARTFSVGVPDPEVAKVIELSAKAFDMIREIIRPNMPIAEMNERMANYYKSVGLASEKWWFGGYELGIAFPPDWVGFLVHDIDLDPGNDRFVPGTVVNYESNFYLPKMSGVSYQINTLVFKQDEAKILGRLRSDLIIIE